MSDAGLADTQPRVRLAAYRLERFPLTAEQAQTGCSDPTRRVRALWASRAKSLSQHNADKLVRDHDPVVRFAAAKHAAASPDADLDLVQGPDPDVRLARALNPHTPTPEAAGAQARDFQPAVRLAAAGHSTLSATNAASLALDAHPEIRAKARDTNDLPRKVLRQSLKLGKTDASAGTRHDPITHRHSGGRFNLRHPLDEAPTDDEVRADLAHNSSPYVAPALLMLHTRPAAAPAAEEPADAATMLRSLGHATPESLAAAADVFLPTGDQIVAADARQCGSVNTANGQPCQLSARSC